MSLMRGAKGSVSLYIAPFSLGAFAAPVALSRSEIDAKRSFTAPPEVVTLPEFTATASSPRP